MIKKEVMDIEDIINYLEEKKLTAYSVNKQTDISINTINDLIERKRKPRKATINKIDAFIRDHMMIKEQFNQVKTNIKNDLEPQLDKNLSNKELLLAFNQKKCSTLLENNKILIDLLIKNHNEIKETLSYITAETSKI